MTLSAGWLAIRWLVRDTFRQALAAGIFWVMLAFSALCILFCFSVGVPADQPGELTVLFGAGRIALAADAHSSIHYLQLLLAGGVADVTGVLLALIWTAGFLPPFLEPGAVSVLLAKPVPRWSLLVGKYLGVLVFVAFQAVVFVGGTWLALALRTGVWDALYLLAVPVLLLHFAIVFSFATLLAVYTRSTVVCVIGAIGFWAMCWGMNFGRHAVLVMPGLEEFAPALRASVEAGYWVLPKPADLGILLFNALGADNYFGQLTVFQEVQSRGAFFPLGSILSSLGFTAVMVALAAYQFVTTDY